MLTHTAVRPHAVGITLTFVYARISALAISVKCTILQSGAAGCEKGFVKFVKCFLRVPQAVGL